KALLPIEVLRFGLASTRAALEKLGLAGEIRRAGDQDYSTDNGNPVIDAAMPAGFDHAELAVRLDALPAVVGHGLFLDEADEVLIEDANGAVARRSRK